MKGKKSSSIDEYIALFPKDVQDILEKMRQTIQNAAPSAAEAISYQMPTFKAEREKSRTFRSVSAPYQVLSDPLRHCCVQKRTVRV
jgi:hypothetical protein